jgi:uncharacterized protein (TIGR02217 family)
MSNNIFPSLNGITWPIPKRANWKTLVSQAESGREVRVALRSYPLFEWDLPYGILRPADQAEFWGFYNECYGGYDTFLFDDKSDDFAPGQQLGVGDGATTQFQFVRSYGGLFVEPRTDIQQTPTAPKIYLNGVHQTSGYSITYFNSGTITFTAAPSNGVVITADFYFYWRVRFKEDQLAIDLIYQGLANLKKVTLAQVFI